MSILPDLTSQDKLRLKSPVRTTHDQGTYVRCDHQGGAISFWRLLRPEELVSAGANNTWTWVVHVLDGPGIPRMGYPMAEESVPERVRNLRHRA